MTYFQFRWKAIRLRYLPQDIRREELCHSTQVSNLNNYYTDNYPSNHELKKCIPGGRTYQKNRLAATDAPWRSPLSHSSRYTSELTPQDRITSATSAVGHLFATAT